MSTAQDCLVRWADQLTEATFFQKTLNQLGWWIVKGLNFLLDGTEELLNKIYETLDFTQYPAIQNFLNSFRPFLWILMAGALLFLGWQLIFNREEAKPKTIQNIVLFIICIFALPNFILTMNELTLQSYEWIQVSGEPTSAASIVKGALTDFMYIDSRGWTQSAKTNNLPNSDKIFNIDITETISPKSEGISSLGADITKQKVSVDENGNYTFEEFKDDKILGITYNEANYYLRYKLDFLTVIISMLAVIIAVFFCCFKIGRLIFEIVIHQLLSVLYAASDLTSGQRVKAVFKSLLSLYVVIFFSSIMIKLFYIYSNYISDAVEGGLTKALLLIIAAFAVIDGPNVIEKTLGLDAGLSSAMQKLSSIYYTSMMGRTIAHTAGAVIGKGKNAAGAGVGFMAGVLHNKSNDTGIHTGESSMDAGINTGESNLDTGINTNLTSDNNSITNNGSNNINSDTNTNGISNNGINNPNNDIALAQSAEAESAKIEGNMANSTNNDINSMLSNSNQSIFDNPNNSISNNISNHNDNLNSSYNNSGNHTNPNSLMGNVQKGYQNGQATRNWVNNHFGKNRKGKR